MKDEVNSAAGFLASLLLAKKVPPAKVEIFRKKLANLLMNHYQDHWFPDKPFKGSGYRCIRFNHNVDPIVEKASRLCGFPKEAIVSLFPRELTMWVDPCDVSYRIGDNGSIGALYGASSNDNSNRSSSEEISLPSNVLHQQKDLHSNSHLHQSDANLLCGQQASHHLQPYHAEMAQLVPVFS